MRDREVHDGGPQAGEQQPGAERARSAIAPEISATVMIANIAWKRRTRSSGWCRTADLRCAEQAVEAEELERLAEQTAADVLAERHGVAEQHPEDTDDADRAEAHHHHVEHALRPDHAAVEEGKPGVISSTSAALVSTQAVSPVSTSTSTARRLQGASVCPVSRGCA